ncbi:MAG: hypothetical protein QXP81_11145 [Nitrososphaerota archaeon]
MSEVGQIEGKLCKVISIQRDGKLRLPRDVSRFLGIDGMSAKAAVYLVEKEGVKEVRLRILEVFY